MFVVRIFLERSVFNDMAKLFIWTIHPSLGLNLSVFSLSNHKPSFGNGSCLVLVYFKTLLFFYEDQGFVHRIVLKKKMRALFFGINSG